MLLNDAGKMIQKWYYELANKFKDIECLEMVVMPNHFHCIIHNVGLDAGVPVNGDSSSDPLLGEHLASPLGQVIQWFKTMSTNEYMSPFRKVSFVQSLRYF